MRKKIILIRHADANIGGLDPGISQLGKEESLELAKIILAKYDGKNIKILSSCAARAQETAEIIKQEIQINEILLEKSFWSNYTIQTKLNGLKKRIANIDCDILIILVHLDHIRCITTMLGFGVIHPLCKPNCSGVLIENNQCTNFP
jgi:phosphohistidine phosphatase SixA